MDIGTRIKTLRKARGLTQVDLAKKLGTTQKAICDYEKGSAKPSRERLPKLATILGISVDELLGSEPTKINADNSNDINHIHGNSRLAKLQNLFEKLSPDDQRAVLKHINGLLAQTAGKNNGSRFAKR